MNILIIGATSGIGKALFEKYIIEGNRLGIVGRRAYLLDEFYQQHPDKSKVYVTKRWHFLAIINKNLPFVLYKRI